MFVCVIPSVLCFNCVCVRTCQQRSDWTGFLLHIRANASWKLMTSRRAWFKSSHKASGFRRSATNNYCTHSTIIFNIHRFKNWFFGCLLAQMKIVYAIVCNILDSPNRFVKCLLVPLSFAHLAVWKSKMLECIHLVLC